MIIKFNNLLTNMNTFFGFSFSELETNEEKISFLLNDYEFPSDMLKYHSKEELNELRRFFALKVIHDDFDVETPKLSPSLIMDSCWHRFLTYTDEYVAMCMRLGKMIHHNPKTKLYNSQERYEFTRKAYEDQFGSLYLEYETDSDEESVC